MEALADTSELSDLVDINASIMQAIAPRQAAA
jgi:hypothetical protein